jgi:NADPH:quinone reductase-like Zn-dependent oxidoreductase
MTTDTRAAIRNIVFFAILVNELAWLGAGSRRQPGRTRSRFPDLGRCPARVHADRKVPATTMKAIVCTEYGPPDVLKLQEVEKPTPAENEILVRIHAVPVKFGDLLARHFDDVSPARFTMPFPLSLPVRIAFGWNKPKNTILGSEFAGEVESVGQGISRFRAGDQVFGYRGSSFGAYAEYLCMPADGTVALMPVNMTHEEAASLPGGAITALNLLKKAEIQKGHRVLVNGASGGIGSAAVQLAKHAGAEVNGVCGTPRLEMVRALGADKVIDYTQEDFAQSGETYDLILDVLGKAPFSRSKSSLSPDGRHLYASFKMKQLFEMLCTLLRNGPKVVCAMALESPEDMVQIKELAETGALRAVIDRCYPLGQAAEAHRYVETGQKTGEVVLTVGQEE